MLHSMIACTLSCQQELMTEADVYSAAHKAMRSYTNSSSNKTKTPSKNKPGGINSNSRSANSSSSASRSWRTLVYSATVGVISGISGILMAPLYATIYWLVTTNSDAPPKVTHDYIIHT
jgi:type IV secretory pathway component VirB8